MSWFLAIVLASTYTLISISIELNEENVTNGKKLLSNWIKLKSYPSLKLKLSKNFFNGHG